MPGCRSSLPTAASRRPLISFRCSLAIKGSAQPKADLAVRIYELASGKQVAALVGHTDEITGLAFSPDSRMIATAAGNFWHRKDRTVRVWDVATGHALHVFDNPDGTDRSSISLTAEGWSLSAWMAWRPSGMFRFHSHATNRGDAS